MKYFLEKLGGREGCCGGKRRRNGVLGEGDWILGGMGVLVGGCVFTPSILLSASCPTCSEASALTLIVNFVRQCFGAVFVRCWWGEMLRGWGCRMGVCWDWRWLVEERLDWGGWEGEGMERADAMDGVKGGGEVMREW